MLSARATFDTFATATPDVVVSTLFSVPEVVPSKIKSDTIVSLYVELPDESYTTTSSESGSSSGSSIVTAIYMSSPR